MILAYKLDPNEVAIHTTTNNNQITEPYVIETVEPNYSYAVKLFAYPNWNPTTQSYDLTWWLCTLDRNTSYDVSGLVVFSHNTGPFNPQLYGVVQEKVVSIDLSNVSPTFKPYIHIQSVHISLLSQPTNLTNSWTVDMEPDETPEPYGIDILATINSSNPKAFVIHNNMLTLTEWLDTVYYPTHPLINPENEIGPMVPTHIQVINGTLDVIVPVEEYVDSFESVDDVVPNSLVIIKFIRRTVSGDLHLSVAGMMVVSQA